MEITDVEPIVLESAVDTVSLHGGRADFDATVRPVLVKIHTDSEIVGLGESYLDDPTGDKAKFVAQGVNALANHLVGADPRNVRQLWHELYVHTKRSGSYRSLSAIDEALWDIKGKDAGKPVYQLLGGQTGEVSAYATFPHKKSIEELIEAGEWLSAKGFETMKIVVGADVETDRQRIHEVATGLPDDLGLAMDANTTFDFPDAFSLAQTASEHGMEWFEEPIAHTDIKGQGDLNTRVPVSISGYQNHRTQYPAVDHLRHNALEIYQPALDLVGGITPADAVATLCEAHGKRFVPHAFGPAVNYSASLHVAAAHASCSLIEFAIYDEDIDDPGRFVASPYVDNQDAIYVQDGGRIDPPESPGLGLTIDEATLKEYRTE